jgi:hypothetical protein
LPSEWPNSSTSAVLLTNSSTFVTLAVAAPPAMAANAMALNHSDFSGA